MLLYHLHSPGLVGGTDVGVTTGGAGVGGGGETGAGVGVNNRWGRRWWW